GTGHGPWAGGGDGSGAVWALKTGKALRRLEGGAPFVSWDRDGRRLTGSAQNHTVVLWPADGGPARRSFGPIQGLFHDRQPAFSPDGNRLALAVEKAVAGIYDASTRPGLHRPTGPPDFVSALIWGPPGQGV